MLGLSITAIGMRSLSECLQIFHRLRKPMGLEFLELAIGSPCDVDADYRNIPLVLHDSCLYRNGMRVRLSPLQPRSWQLYTEFIASHDARAVSLHPPLLRDCTRFDLETGLARMQEKLQIPVYIEVMPSPEYWCSSINTLVDFPLLLDVSHVAIWHQGDILKTQETCLSLLNDFPVGAIHLSHNNGLTDTHDLIPESVWFASYIDRWLKQYLVTYESLPKSQAAWERLDKRNRKLGRVLFK